METKYKDKALKKIIEWHFKGLPQAAIAEKCGVSQATVSRCIKEFNESALAFGIDKAAKGSGVMNVLAELRGLAIQMYKYDISVQEAKACVDVGVLFKQFDVIPAEYSKLARSFLKVKEPNFTAAAIKLIELEGLTGKGYAEALARYGKVTKKLEKADKALSSILEQRDQVTKNLRELKHDHQQEKRKLSAFIKDANARKHEALDEVNGLSAKTALAKEQLTTVHAVVAASHELGIADADLTGFLEERLHLQRVGVSQEKFGAVAGALVEAGNLDVENLKGMLRDFGTLKKSLDALNTELTTLYSEIEKLRETKIKLEKVCQDLKDDLADRKMSNEELVKTRKDLKEEITLLIAEKNTLGPRVQQLSAREHELLREIMKIKQRLFTGSDDLN